MDSEGILMDSEGILMDFEGSLLDFDGLWMIWRGFGAFAWLLRPWRARLRCHRSHGVYPMGSMTRKEY